LSDKYTLRIDLLLLQLRIRLSDFNTSYALSGNSEYIRSAKGKGILRWDLMLEPDTFDDSATIVTYEYTLKYDNDMHIGAVTN
jgi:hypothetical protein